jgi:tRNA 2-selenouridine synthase
MAAGYIQTMAAVIDCADPRTLAGFDEIIDVRTPAEFALDHAPGAVNLPVLSDSERAMVGTIYVQESRLKARRTGAALVARNIAGHLEAALRDKPGAYAPLIYCWRGGQRSLAMATVLEQVGWRPTRLAGGYMTYRRRVSAALYEGAPPERLILLDGSTGSAKTEILGRLAAHGVQTLDLEGLAQHRGSLFGARPGEAQPSQKRFESRLLAALETLEPSRPIVVEAESSKIGQINLPPALWRAMALAPRIELAAPRPARIAYLVGVYGDLAAETGPMTAAIEALPGRHGARRRASWRALLAAADLAALAGDLVDAHYDPAYERSRRRDGRVALGRVEMADLSARAQEDAARRIADLVRAHAG